MPLPNPDYLTAQPFNWDETTKQAILLDSSAAITGVKRSIRWEACDEYDRQRVHDLLTGYNDRAAAPVAEANIVTGFIAARAYHTLDFGGSVVGGNSTGLVSGEIYTASVVVNGTETVISIDGANGLTFTALLATIDGIIPSTVDTVIFDGNIEFTSATAAAGQVVEVFDQNLFSSCEGASLDLSKEIRVGVTTIGDVFDLNYKDGYQTYTDLLIGALSTVSNKSHRSARSVNDVYYNHGTGTWLLVYTDVAPV